MSDEFDSWRRPANPPTAPSSGRSSKREKPQQTESDGKKAAPLTPDWYAARNALLEKIAANQRRRGVTWTTEQRAESEAAMQMALSDPSQPGHDEIERAYIRAGAARVARLSGRPLNDVLSRWGG